MLSKIATLLNAGNLEAWNVAQRLDISHTFKTQNLVFKEKEEESPACSFDTTTRIFDTPSSLQTPV